MKVDIKFTPAQAELISKAAIAGAVVTVEGEAGDRYPADAFAFITSPITVTACITTSAYVTVHAHTIS
jgi:hypothetical protein